MTDPYADEVRRKAERLARARRDRRSVWVALGHAGTFGWQLALPLLAGALLGRALAEATGAPGVTLAGIAIGLILGLWAAGRGLAASLRDDDEEDAS